MQPRHWRGKARRLTRLHERQLKAPWQPLVASSKEGSCRDALERAVTALAWAVGQTALVKLLAMRTTLPLE